MIRRPFPRKTGKLFLLPLWKTCGKLCKGAFAVEIPRFPHFAGSFPPGLWKTLTKFWGLTAHLIEISSLSGFAGFQQFIVECFGKLFGRFRENPARALVFQGFLFCGKFSPYSAVRRSRGFFVRRKCCAFRPAVRSQSNYVLFRIILLAAIKSVSKR